METTVHLADPAVCCGKRMFDARCDWTASNASSSLKVKGGRSGPWPASWELAAPGSTRGKPGQPQQSFGIRVRDLLALVRGKVEVVEPVERPTIIGERVVHRKDHVVVAKRFPRQFKGACIEVATGGDPEVVAVVRTDRLAVVTGERSEDVIDAPQEERDAFAKMTQDHLQPGVTVEDTGDDHARRVQRGFIVPPVGPVSEHQIDRWVKA